MLVFEGPPFPVGCFVVVSCGYLDVCSVWENTDVFFWQQYGVLFGGGGGGGFSVWLSCGWHFLHIYQEESHERERDIPPGPPPSFAQQWCRTFSMFWIHGKSWDIIDFVFRAREGWGGGRFL